ncbi:MAG: type IV toxin-antitoxin system AbiEi family antitoxin domain-containing protein [Micromonosporaceae bacterium]
MELYYQLRMLAARQHGVVTATQCRALGASPRQVALWCRDKRWLRISRGVYLVDADLHAEVPRRALIRAATFSAGPQAVAVLATAAELHGLAGLRPEKGVHVSLPGVAARARRVLESGLRPHQLVLRSDEVTLVDGIAVTTPARTVADLLLRVDRYSAVCVLDSGLYRGLFSTDDLPLIGAMLTGRRGAVKARPWLAEADGRAESPLETRIRLRCVDGGVPPDTLQHPVRDGAGNLIAVGDLAWLKWRIIAEGDGVDAHENPVAVFRDRTRQNDLVTAGYTTLRFTWPDTMHPSYIPQVVRRAHIAAVSRRHGPSTRVDLPLDRSWGGRPDTPPTR